MAIARATDHSAASGRPGRGRAVHLARTTVARTFGALGRARSICAGSARSRAGWSDATGAVRACHQVLPGGRLSTSGRTSKGGLACAEAVEAWLLTDIGPPEDDGAPSLTRVRRSA